MENKKHKNFNLILYILTLLSVIIMLIAFYFLFRIKVVEPTKENVIVNKFEMLIMFNGNNQINAHNIKEGFEESREFTIENVSEDSVGKYKIILEVITPLSNMIDEKFVYTLESSSISKDTTNDLISVSETPIPVLTKDLGRATITPKNTHTYKINFKLKKGARKYPKENMFSIKVKVVNDD